MTTTSEAATEAMQEARKKWMRGKHGPPILATAPTELALVSMAYEAGFRAAMAWAAKEGSGGNDGR